MTTSVRFRYVVIKISADIQSCKAALLHGCAEEEGSDLHRMTQDFMKELQGTALTML